MKDTLHQLSDASILTLENYDDFRGGSKREQVTLNFEFSATGWA